MPMGALLLRLIKLIAVATCITGLAQVVAPDFVLTTLHAERTATSRHFFAIVGMFMTLFGGLTLHALARPAQASVVLLWSGLQKLGAALAVGIGVWHGLFSPLGLLVACFDLFTGLIMLFYRSRYVDSLRQIP